MRTLRWTGWLVLWCHCALAGPVAHALSEPHRLWVEEEVAPILSDREREAFLELVDDRARNLFIEAFWNARDPTPGTALNEYRERYRERVEEADRLFRKGKQRGSLTQRGRVWVQLGPPRSRLRYDGESRLYPLEHWFYQVPPEEDLPRFFNLIFFRAYGVGDYELYDPILHGPEKLVGGYLPRRQDGIRAPGAESSTATPDGRIFQSSEGDLDYFKNQRKEALRELYRVDPQLQHIALSPIPGDPVDAATGQIAPSVGLLAARLHDYPNRQPVDTSYADRVLDEKVTIEYEFRNLGMRAYLYGGFGHGAGVLHYAIQIPPGSLTLHRFGRRASGALEVLGQVVRADDELTVHSVDETIEIALSADELERIESHPVALEDVVPLLPGTYTVRLVVRDRVARQFGVVEGTVEIPRPVDGLALATPLLAVHDGPLGDDASAPFAFDGVRYYPAIHHDVWLGGQMHVLSQVQLPTTGASTGEIELLVLPSGGDRAVWSYRGALTGSSAGHALSAVEVPLDRLTVGPYELQVAIQVGGERRERRVNFTAIPEPAGPSPWVVVNQRPRGQGATTRVLAEQHLAVGDQAAAMECLARGLDQHPQDVESRQRLAALRLAARDYAGTIAVLQPLAGQPSPPAAALLLLGLAQSGAGDREAAVAHYERALASEPRDAAIHNALAEERQRLGQTDVAIGHLRRSLELQPEQDQIRALLARLEQQQQADPPPGP